MTPRCALAAMVGLALASGARAEKVQLFLLPHTHADVGWLELPEALARMLREANVTRIFSTDTRRTRATVAPLAEQLELEIEPYKTRGFAVKLGAMKGETVAVSGHSNTVPAIARALGGELAGLTDDGHFPDDQYDRVINELQKRLHINQPRSPGLTRQLHAVSADLAGPKYF